MKIRHLILMLLKATGGKISGKTKIQKQIYFLSLILSKDIGFKAHYYGPYSPLVEQGIDELIGAGFVKINYEYFGYDKKKDFEVKRYDFSLTNSGSRFSKILAEENPEEYLKIEKFIKTLEQVGNPDYISLSIAAKASFILNKIGEPITTDQLLKEAEKLGWDVEKEDISKSIEILKILGFVKECSKR